MLFILPRYVFFDLTHFNENPEFISLTNIVPVYILSFLFYCCLVDSMGTFWQVLDKKFGKEREFYEEEIEVCSFWFI